MFSALIFVPLAGVSAWMSKRASNRKASLEGAQSIERASAVGAGAGVYFANFFPYSENPMKANDAQWLTLREHVYDVYQEMYTSQYGNYTSNSSDYRTSTVTKFVEALSPEYARGLLSKLHDKFAITVENYVADDKPPPTLYSHDIALTPDFKLNFRNRPHVGVKYIFTGVPHNNGDQYLVVGRFNGQRFTECDYLEKNKTVEDLVVEEQFTASAYKWTTVGICVVGIAAAVTEFTMNRASRFN